METNTTALKLENIILLFLFIFITYLFPYLPGHESDRNLWTNWTKHIYENGLSKTYYSGTDYLPIYHYFLYLFGKFFKSAEGIESNINYLRSFTLIFEFLGLWYVYKWIDKRFSYFLIALFSILNISFSYNTILWGQIDAILSTMIFISFYYAWKNKMIVSSIWLVLALNLKLQGIIFLPVWGLLFINYVLVNKNAKAFFLPLITITAVQLLILIPFMMDERGIEMIRNVITSSVGRYPRVSMNAFNFWHIMLHNPWDTMDDQKFAGITYKYIGLILFFTSSLFVLVPLIKKVIKNWKEKTFTIDRDQLWLTCSLISILFFFFNTQMHERYLHPAFIFITAYSFYTKNFLPYLFFSLAYFLNMEKVLKVLDLNSYGTLIFEPQFIAALFIITIILLTVRLYKPATH